MNDYAPLMERAFSLDICEQSYVVEEIEGGIPDSIGGACYLDGPARFLRGGLDYRRRRDGDGIRERVRSVHESLLTVRSAPPFETKRNRFGNFEFDSSRRGKGLPPPSEAGISHA